MDSAEADEEALIRAAGDVNPAEADEEAPIRASDDGPVAEADQSESPIRAVVEPEPDQGPTDALAPLRSYPLTLGPSSDRVGAGAAAVILIGGLPEGASLSAGVAARDGTWTLSPEQLAGLAISVPPGTPEPFALQATSISIDREGAMSAVTREVPVGADNIADALAARRERRPIALNLVETIRELAGDASPRAVVIGGLPPGAELCGGTYDPQIECWVMRPDQLEGVSVSQPAGQVGPLRARVTVVFLDQAGRSSTTTRLVEVDAAAQGSTAPSFDPPTRVGGVGFWRPRAQRRA